MANRFLLIFLLILEVLNGKEFIVSYKLFSKNHIVESQEYSVSKPMVSNRVKNGSFFCVIPKISQDGQGRDEQNKQIGQAKQDAIVPFVEIEDEKEFLQIYKNDVIECLMRGNVFLKSLSSDSNHISSQNIIHITIPPTLIDVIFFKEGGFCDIVVFDTPNR